MPYGAVFSRRSKDGNPFENASTGKTRGGHPAAKESSRLLFTLRFPTGEGRTFADFLLYLISQMLSKRNSTFYWIDALGVQRFLHPFP